MGSPGTVEAYVKAIRKFVKFIGLQDPETALNKLQNGEVNGETQADAFIDYALDKKNGSATHTVQSETSSLALRNGSSSTESR